MFWGYSNLSIIRSLIYYLWRLSLAFSRAHLNLFQLLYIFTTRYRLAFFLIPPISVEEVVIANIFLSRYFCWQAGGGGGGREVRVLLMPLSVISCFNFVVLFMSESVKCAFYWDSLTCLKLFGMIFAVAVTYYQQAVSQTVWFSKPSSYVVNMLTSI